MSAAVDITLRVREPRRIAPIISRSEMTTGLPRARLLPLLLLLVTMCSCRSMSPPPASVTAVGDQRQSVSTDIITPPAQAFSVQTASAEQRLVVDSPSVIQELPEEIPAPNTITDHGVPLESYPAVPRLPVGLPDQAWTGPVAPAWAFEQNGPSLGPWKPPGIAEPWPRDEWIIDGGDREQHVVVAPDFDVFGLDQEDAVAHYETVRGEMIVKPTNCVPIYAPRFAAVRKVTGIALHAYRQQTVGVEAPVGPELHADLGITNTLHQPIGPEGSRAADKPVGYREHRRQMGLVNVQRLEGIIWKLLPYEDLVFVRDGLLLNSEKARLAEAMLAAITWNSDQGLQLLINETPPLEVALAERTEGIHVYEVEPGKPCLRVCKLASDVAAKPGDEIHFTIRFDNLGTEPIGNVTILDNLNTRLEYIEGSAASSLEADFYTVENEGGSVILRWEIIDPLEVGQGGVVRFKCRVR